MPRANGQWLIANSRCRGGADTRDCDHGLGGRHGVVIGPHEGVGHGVASGRSVKLEEDAVDAGRLKVRADGGRGGSAALYAAAAIEPQVGTGLWLVFCNKIH